jgi:hypothetical protein
MTALQAIKEQWDSGDAGKSTSFGTPLADRSLLTPSTFLAVLIDDILRVIDAPADVKMEVTAT